MAATTSNLRGVLLMVSAVAVFALMDGGLKLLSEHYPPMQVAALRGLASLPLAAAWALATVGVGGLLRIRWPLHLLRGVLAVTMMAGFIGALRGLPLSTVYALFFVAPLMVTALAVPVLGEKVGPRRWTAIVIGLAGVLVVLRPSGDGLATAAGAMVLLAALSYAVSAVTVRVLARTDSTQALVFWMLALLGLGAGALAYPDWVAVQWRHGWLIAGIGVLGMIGQILITEAFRHGEASLIAPFEYTALAWSVLLDATLWGVLPDRPTWLGAAIIIASGLYLIRREKVHAEAEHP